MAKIENYSNILTMYKSKLEALSDLFGTIVTEEKAKTHHFSDKHLSDKPLSDKLSNAKNYISNECSCGVICLSCDMIFLDKCVSEKIAGQFDNENLIMTIMKKIDINVIPTNYRNVILNSICSIVEIQKSMKNHKKQDEESKKLIKREKQKITSQRMNFRMAIANLKDIARKQNKDRFNEDIKKLSQQNLIQEQIMTIQKFEIQNAMKLTVKYYDLYYKANLYISELINHKRSIKDINIVSDTSASPVFSNKELKKQSQIEKSLQKQLSEFEEKMKQSNKSIEEVERERQLLELQLNSERKRLYALLDAEKKLQEERELRFKFEKIAIQQEANLKEKEFEIKIQNLQKELLEKSLALSKQTTIIEPINMDNVLLPQDATLDLTTYGARVFVSNKYPGYVWRNCKWYKIEPNMRFQNLTFGEAVHRNQITDDFYEFHASYGRIFYCQRDRDFHYLYDTTTGVLNLYTGICSYAYEDHKKYSEQKKQMAQQTSHLGQQSSHQRQSQTT